MYDCLWFGGGSRPFVFYRQLWLLISSWVGFSTSLISLIEHFTPFGGLGAVPTSLTFAFNHHDSSILINDHEIENTIFSIELIVRSLFRY